jgi:hypothetical protein
MEIILAIVVAVAVIFFGALISMGNERQRKAIDNLGEQVVRWAVQDLKIKREHLAREARVQDPIRWLTEVSGKVTGRSLSLHLVEVFDEPQAILCQSPNIDTTIIFSPLSPKEVRRRMSAGKGKLDSLNSHPLQKFSTRWVVHELSVLNAGILFDIELTLAWKALAGQEISTSDRLWMYVQEIPR